MGFSRPRNATMIAVNPYPGDTDGNNCPIVPDTSAIPANPAKPPLIIIDSQINFDLLKPAYLAANGAKPTTLN